MEKWEVRYLHEKAVRNAVYKMNGWKIPENEPYGTLLENKMTRSFNGKIFFDLLKEEGNHTNMDFDRCDCNRR